MTAWATPGWQVPKIRWGLASPSQRWSSWGEDLKCFILLWSHGCWDIPTQHKMPLPSTTTTSTQCLLVQCHPETQKPKLGYSYRQQHWEYRFPTLAFRYKKRKSVNLLQSPVCGVEEQPGDIHLVQPYLSILETSPEEPLILRFLITQLEEMLPRHSSSDLL